MVEMFKIVNSIAKIVILLISFLSYHVLTYSHVMESFLPSLINVRPEIQMRRFNSLRDPKENVIEITNMTYTIYPQFCVECKDGVSVVVLVHSYVANFESRKVIRETWGKSSNCVKVVFFIGTTYDSNIMRKVINESIEHYDIVQGNIEDTFKNLPYKHIMSLKWVKLLCPGVKYILKTDSDIIVRLDKLYKMLKKDIWGSKKLIAGHIVYNEVVLRQETGVISNKIVSDMEYPETLYPPYCWGPFVLYSADAAFSLLEESKKVPYFKIEDIYVTGILAKNVEKIRYMNLVPHYYLTRKILYNYTKNDAKKDYVYGPYSLTLDEIRNFWNIILKHEQVVVVTKPSIIIRLPSVKPRSPFLRHEQPFVTKPPVLILSVKPRNIFKRSSKQPKKFSVRTVILHKIRTIIKTNSIGTKKNSSQSLTSPKPKGISSSPSSLQPKSNSSLSLTSPKPKAISLRRVNGLYYNSQNITPKIQNYLKSKFLGKRYYLSRKLTHNGSLNGRRSLPKSSSQKPKTTSSLTHTTHSSLSYTAPKSTGLIFGTIF